MNEILPVLGVVIAALLGAVPGVLALRGQYRKYRAESDSTVVGDAMKIVEQYRVENAAMRAEIAELRARVLELETMMKAAGVYHSGAVMLAHQVRALGHTPVFDPLQMNTE